MSTAGEALCRRRGFLLAARGASLPSWGECSLWAGRALRRRGGVEGAVRTARCGRRTSDTRRRRSRYGIRWRKCLRRWRWSGGGMGGRRRRAGIRRSPVQDVVFVGPPPGRCRPRRAQTPFGFAAPSRPRRRSNGTASCRHRPPTRRGVVADVLGAFLLPD